MTIDMKGESNQYETSIYLLFLLLHTVLFCLIANLHEVKLTYTILILSSLLFSLFTIFYLNKPVYLLYHLVFCIVFQNILIGLGNNFTDYQDNGSNIKLLLVYKELFASIVLVLLFLKYKNNIKLLSFEKVIYPLFLVIALSFVLSSSPTLESKLFYLRQFTILFISYFIGRLIYYGLKNNLQDLYKLIKFIIALGVFTVFIGFIFNLFDLDSYIWNEWMNIDIVLQAKGVQGGLPNWSTPLGNFVVPRMFSIFYDVINFSYFILVALCCSLMLKRNNSLIFIRAFLLLGLFLTLGKGALGIYSIVLVWVFFLYSIKLKPKIFILPLLIVLTVCFIVAYNIDFRSSAIVHFNGFILPLISSYEYPLGNGVGAGGIYYAMLSGISAWDLSHLGTESFFGSLIYQLGYPGLVLYLIFFIGCINFLLKNAYNNEINYLLIVLSGILFATFIISLFQEATLGINYTGILTIIIGYTVSRILEPKLL
ncbi:hypothetical protein [Bacillus sp. AFS040349]|uniref:hypothetical protein n=1 Tax=Bacillus sp. AFS040349 TaxID=2033502 RepID=UPI0011456817|nr:hypothetical protein [Bacillus sp. AFS040349]